MKTRAYFSFVVVILLAVTACGARAVATNEAVFVWLEGEVMIARAGSQTFVPARTNDILKIGDIIRTGDDGRATIALWDKCMLRVLNNGRQVIQDGHAGKPAVKNQGGSIYLFIRELFGQTPARSQIATGATRGTELHLFVDPADDRSVFTVIDGEVDVTNEFGAVTLTRGQQTEIRPGEKPQPPAAIETTRVIQWCLYYPAVLDAAELNFTDEEKQRLAESLTAYAQGDLARARQTLRAAAVPSEAERTYAVALWLAFADVPRAETLLTGIDSPQATALARLIAVVQNRAGTNATAPTTASGWMAESYDLQARSKLPEALAAARAAARVSPQFGFAHARVAELEFSFAHRAEAGAALDQALRLSPRHGAAWVLRGFVHAAGNDHRTALADFEHAVSLDGTLPTAWLGRGLIKIRLGRSEEGRRDLQVAAVLQPSQSIFRSYLGKAWAEVGETKLAEKDFALARRLDTNDPTPLLYSALLKQSENRINEAVRDLERSAELNDNRSVYRSAQLLDQDRAVRSANLASIYLDAGMIDVSVREAVRAVNYDYANYSAHLFLANSYDRLRDPRQINLRYETPWLSEYLLANLLAPVGAGTLSQSVSQQEYSRLFERDKLGMASSTEYLSRGAWQQDIVQHGQFGNTAYAVEAYYLTDPGERVNHDVQQRSLSLQFKQQLTPSDGLYFQAIVGDARSGDLNQYADPARANPLIRVQEEQKPLLLAGYHHEWAPGSHTLVLLSGLSGKLEVNDPTGSGFLIRTNAGAPHLLRPMRFRQEYENTLGIFGAEAQQILQLGSHTLVAGVLGQFGGFDTDNRHTLTLRDPYDFGAFNAADPKPQSIDNSFERETVYVYDTWRIWTPFRITAGLAYDRVVFPENHRYAPVLEGSLTEDQLSPKAGWEWLYAAHGAVRFAWTRSLSGASFDQSFRLEPVQVAGFNQAFRSLIPETLTGANAGAPFETFGLAWEQRFGSGTYVGAGANWFLSDFDRTRGTYLLSRTGRVVPDKLTERLDYEEQSVHLSVDQIVGRDWVLGARYEFSRARLETSYPDAPPLVTNGEFTADDEPILYTSRHTLEGDLHQIGLRAAFNHPSGFFAGTEGVWHGQLAESERERLVSSRFWQWNARAGWRSPRRHIEASVGLLNILDQSAGLHPINLHLAPPQRRTFVAGLRFKF